MNKAVIYDLDGLMVDSINVHVKSSDLALKKYGHSAYDVPESIRATFAGKKIIDILKATIEYLKIPIDVIVLNKERNRIFYKLIHDELCTMPGLHYSLDFFKNEGFTIALVSSGTQRYVDIVLKKFNIKKYFQVIITGDDVKNGKPDPEPYQKAVQKLNTQSRNCIVLEDAANGIESAKTTGCKCIAIQSRSDLKQDFSKADVVLKSLNDVSAKTISLLFD